MTHSAKLPIQIIGPTVIARLRKQYAETWKRPWPFGGSYLAELVVEAKAELGLPPSAKNRVAEVRAETLVKMRLDHEFTP